jgi:hypothetical protein
MAMEKEQEGYLVEVSPLLLGCGEDGREWCCLDASLQELDEKYQLTSMNFFLARKFQWPCFQV